MDKSIAVIRHIGIEGLGTIEDVLKSRNLTYRYIDAWKDVIPADVTDWSALILLGGPMGVYERDRYPFIEKELSLITKARKTAIPVIGICFGAQMVAQAAGGHVYKGETKEIGWYDITLSGQVSDNLLSDPAGGSGTTSMKVFQWHGDTFDLPGDAELLASSKLYRNQAFRVDNLYGLQFHVEVREADIREWIRAYATELNGCRTAEEVNSILEDTKMYIHTLNTISMRVFTHIFSYI